MRAPVETQHKLVLDGGVLEEAAPRTHPGGYRFSVVGEDLTFGSPVPKELVLQSMMSDGSLVRKVGDDNREAGFRVMIEGPDTAALAKGEQALSLLLGKRTTMEWHSSDGVGAPTVFDVVTSSMAFLDDDVDEVRNMRWTFRVRLICLPYGRSPNLVSVAGDIIGDATIFNACDSVTGWTASRALPEGGDGPLAITVDTSVKYQGTASLKTSGDPWRIDYQNNSGFADRVWYRHSYSLSGVSVSGVYYSFVARVEADDPGAMVTGDPNAGGNNSGSWRYAGSESFGGGWYRYTFARPAGYPTDTIVGFSLRFATSADGTPGQGHMWLDQIEARGTTSSLRQSMRSFEVLGSVRAPGSLAIEHDTLSLGEVTVWMGEDRGDGYRPDMRRWRAASGGDTSTPNTQAVSGSYSTGTGIRYEAPASMFSPGSYVAVIRAKFPTATTVTSTLTARLVSGAGVEYGDATSLKASFPVPSDAFRFITLGVVELPPTRVARESTATLRIQLSGVLVPSGGLFDELWLYRVDDESTLLSVDCGGETAPSAAGPYNRLWVDVPSIDQPRGGVWVGTQANRSDARHPGLDLKSKAVPNLVPPRVQIHMVTPGAPGAKPTLSYHPHDHTHNSVGATDG